MNFFIGISNSLVEVWSHKLRSLLTILCVCLAVASMVAITSLIGGLVSSWNQWFVEFGGLEKIEVPAEEIPDGQEQTLYSSLTIEDADVIRRACPHAANVSPVIDIDDTPLQHEGNIYRTSVEGAEPDVLPVERYEVAKGRFLTPVDDAGFESVVVLGTAIVDALFQKNEAAIGCTIRIDDQPFTVIGVLKHYELMQDGKNVLDLKNQIAFVPLRTMQKRLAGVAELNGVDVRVTNVAYLREVADQIANALLQLHHGTQGYKIQTSEEMKEGLVDSEKSYFEAGSAVAGVSLLVGGIGIMNLMLASINERVREIGVRKAVGAWDRDIFVQFLAEAMLLSLLGGILGILSGVAVVRYLQILLADSSPPILSFWAVGVGFSVSVAIGIISGVYPAFRASRLDPIEALRYD